MDELTTCAGNIVVLSRLPASSIFILTKNKKYQDLKTELLAFQEVFEDDFCIELQRLGKSFEEEFIQHILPLASELSIPVIASNDTMFSQKEDFDIHETKVCINTGKTLNDSNRERLFTSEQFFKSSMDISEVFYDCDPDTLIAHTHAIAKKCNGSLNTEQYYLPDDPVPKNKALNYFLSERSKTQLTDKMRHHS